MYFMSLLLNETSRIWNFKYFSQPNWISFLTMYLASTKGSSTATTSISSLTPCLMQFTWPTYKSTQNLLVVVGLGRNTGAPWTDPRRRPSLPAAQRWRSPCLQVLGDGHVVPQVPVAECRDPAPLAVILRLLIPMLLSRCGIPAGCMITTVMEKQKIDIFLESVYA